MRLELQQSMQQLMQSQEMDVQVVAKEVSHFSPIDFRMGIQWLVTQNQEDLAQALAEAGLSLYPQSEDILAMAGLLAMSRQDWELAIELLQDLIAVQHDLTQPMTFQMLARALACNLDLAEAHLVIDKALRIWPTHPLILQEKLAMSASQEVMSAPTLHN
jgi:tetratricopeptide (TPR) repeat protein